MAEDKIRTPLLLQDMCMLHVLLRLEDFPAQSLALLSHTVRRKICLGISYADLLHLGDGSLDRPMMFADVVVPYFMIEARQELLHALLAKSFNITVPLMISCLNVLSVLGDDSHALHSHICECYPSLEPTLIGEYIFPRRSLTFVDLQSHSNGDLILRLSRARSLLKYCNMPRAPTELRIDINGFKSSVFWLDFDKYMTNISNHAHAYSDSNPKICLDIPLIQEFFSSVEVLEIGSYHYTVYYQTPSLEEDTHVIPYVLLYNILTNSQPRLKHIKVYGTSDCIQQVISTIVELLQATCRTPSKSLFCLHTGLEPLSLLSTPYLLEGISILPYEKYREGYICEFTTAACSSSISRDLMSVLSLQMHKLRSLAVNSLGYTCDLDHMIIIKDANLELLASGKTNINVSEYRAFLTLLVQFIKQPQFTQLAVVTSPLPEGFELIIAFLCTPASHEQSLTIKASSQKSVEEAKEIEDDNEEKEDEEDWIVNVKTNEDDKTPPKMKFRSDLSMKPPRFPSQSLPLTNGQYKCLDLDQSSDCVYAWLFNQLPELKLKSLKMKTLDMTIVPTDMVIQVEHVAITLNFCSYFSSDRPIVTSAHLEKFVLSNPALKRLEIKNECVKEYATNFLPALNQCLLKLNQQGRGLDELILTFDGLDIAMSNASQLKELFVRVRDFSHRYGTVLILSTDLFCHLTVGDFFLDLGMEFQERKIKKIISYVTGFSYKSTPFLQLITESVIEKQYKSPYPFYHMDEVIYTVVD